tara:strand:- start:1843 stop:2031 length:189 start_codon:yes stop_codon:yes gene_type:complete
MSKTKKYEEIANKPKKPDLSEVLSNLRVNHEEYTKKAQFYSNMALKAQGAIEVLEQITKEEE